MAVWRRHDAVPAQVNSGSGGNRTDLVLGADQHGDDQAQFGRFHRTAQCVFGAGMDHRDGNRVQALSECQQLAVAQIAVRHAHLHGAHARTADLLGRRYHQRAAGNHFLAVLVDAAAIQRDMVVFLDLFHYGDLHVQRVAQVHRALKAQALAQVNRAGARVLRA